MRVHELRTVLEHVPDDLEVHVLSWRGCNHVDTVDRKVAGRRYEISGGRYEAGERCPGALVLTGRTTWFENEPCFELRGSFRRADVLLAALDPEVPA